MWKVVLTLAHDTGDAMATIIRRKHAKVHDWSMGAWASHRPGGIRKFPYSTNMTTDSETYKVLDSPGYWGVHAIGEVWAGMVNELVELLILKHGFTRDLFVPLPTASKEEQDAFYLTEDELRELAKESSKERKSKRRVPRHGNTLTVQLLVDGMKLQPCRPGFHDIRDAIVQADENVSGRCRLRCVGSKEKTALLTPDPHGPLHLTPLTFKADRRRQLLRDLDGLCQARPRHGQQGRVPHALGRWR